MYPRNNQGEFGEDFRFYRCFYRWKSHSPEPAGSSAFPALDAFLLLSGACTAARVQNAARSVQTALAALLDLSKGHPQGDLTAGNLLTQPVLSQKLVNIRSGLGEKSALLRSWGYQSKEQIQVSVLAWITGAQRGFVEH